MITANELKTRGIKAIEEQLTQTAEAAITVHGKVKYVAITVEQFDKMRLAEQEVAYMLCKKDIEDGNYTTSLEDHFVELDKEV
ncbi:MAG: hypothetical protein WBO36_07545 [Saprospiraceae bacterium]